MEVQLTPDENTSFTRPSRPESSILVDEVLDSALKSLWQREGITPDLTRSPLAGQRILELRKGLTLGDGRLKLGGALATLGEKYDGVDRSPRSACGSVSWLCRALSPPSFLQWLTLWFRQSSMLS